MKTEFQLREGLPLVSVLMPIFNGGKYLREAVEGILDQTFTDFEFLVLDDGSTDDSLALLRQYAARDSRVRVITRENRGLTFSLNELLSYARGEFVARMDADDVVLPERFARQAAFLGEHPGVVCVGGAYQMIDSADRFLTTLTPPQTDAEIQYLHLSGHTAINHPTAMMRLAAVNRLGGYDSEYDLVEDLDLWLRLGEVGKLANLADVLLKYRLHDKSISEKAGQKQREAARRACESAWRRRHITGHLVLMALGVPVQTEPLNMHLYSNMAGGHGIVASVRQQFFMDGKQLDRNHFQRMAGSC